MEVWLLVLLKVKNSWIHRPLDAQDGINVNHVLPTAVHHYILLLLRQQVTFLFVLIPACWDKRNYFWFH